MTFKFYAPPVRIADLDVGTGENEQGVTTTALTMHGATFSMSAHLSREDTFLLASILVDQLDWFDPIVF